MFLFMIEWMIDHMHHYCINVQNKKLVKVENLHTMIQKLESDAGYAADLAEKLEPMKRDDS